MSIRGNEIRRHMDRLINWHLDTYGMKPERIHLRANDWDYLHLTELHGHFTGNYRDVLVERYDNIVFPEEC